MRPRAMARAPPTCCGRVAAPSNWLTDGAAGFAVVATDAVPVGTRVLPLPMGAGNVVAGNGAGAGLGLGTLAAGFDDAAAAGAEEAPAEGAALLSGAGAVLKFAGRVTPFAAAHVAGSSPSGQQ